MKKKLLAGPATWLYILCFVLMAGNAGAATILTESFETFPPIIGFDHVYSGGSIGAFDVTGGNVDWIGTYWQASDGAHSVDMSGTSLGTIETTFATIIGTTYDVSFAMAGNSGGAGPAVKTLNASVTSATQSVFSGNFLFDTASTSYTNMGWTNYIFQFTALGETSTLEFIDLSTGGSNNAGAALDNIIVSTTPVPVPATIWLIGSGLAGLAGVRRRIKKK